MIKKAISALWSLLQSELASFYIYLHALNWYWKELLSWWYKKGSLVLNQGIYYQNRVDKKNYLVKDNFPWSFILWTRKFEIYLPLGMFYWIFQLRVEIYQKICCSIFTFLYTYPGLSYSVSKRPPIFRESKK